MMKKHIDLTCPAEIFRTALPTEEIPAATLTLYNLSDRVISSVEVLLRLLDAAGNETERLAFRGRALNGRPHSTFLLTVPCAPAAGLKGLDVTIEKVWYADNETWRRDPANTVEYMENNLPVSPALTKLKYAAGETAVGYPSMQDGLWVCVCGRPNPAGEAYCARCGQQMETVFSRFTPEAVETQISLKERQLDLSSRNMREDTIRLQRIREEEYTRKKARRGIRLRLLLTMLLLPALVAAVFLYGGPALRLFAARRALETGDPAGAKAAFTALGSFGNAEEMIAECDWKLALAAAEESTDAEALANASAMLRAVKDKPEAIEKANETDLLRSRLLLGRKKWEEALEALSLLPEDYPGRAELERECLSANARSLQGAGRYEEAREIWLSLGDYADAREQAAACVYQPAKARMNAKDWDGAIALLSMIPDYADSREKTLECHYRKAEELLEAGDTEGASREFLLAGEWNDAPERSSFLIYTQAEELYQAEDYKAAQPLYASIPDYADANDREMACRYHLAKKASDDMEYTLALELLTDIPDTFGETGALRAEASYQKAKIAFSKGEWETAMNLLAGVDRESLREQHMDVETLYLEACKKANKDPYPQTPEPDQDADPTSEPTATPEPTPVPEPDATLNPFLVTEDDQP